MKRAVQASTNPYKNSDTNKRYYTMDRYLREKLGGKGCKVPIDGGATCPNRDGSKGWGGCSFCSSKGSGDLIPKGSITEQIALGEVTMRKKWKDAHIISYFQAFTSTYAPMDVIKARFEEALAFPGISGLCVATRADCITDECAEYLHELSRRTFFMLELGLQTACDRTSERINRCHTYADFLRGYEKVKDLFVCIHLINGLPGEDADCMLETAQTVAALEPSAVKIHMLHVLKGTPIADEYLSGRLRMLSLEEYVSITCDQLERLPPDTVVERLTGDGASSELLAPEWSRKKLVVQNEIDKELFRRNSYQGMRWKKV